MKYFALLFDLVLNFSLMAQIVVVVMQSEHVVLDCLLRDLLVGRHEIPLESFANRLAHGITHDVPITNLLVDCRVVDECALSLIQRLIRHW